MDFVPKFYSVTFTIDPSSYEGDEAFWKRYLAWQREQASNMLRSVEDIVLNGGKNES